MKKFLKYLSFFLLLIGCCIFLCFLPFVQKFLAKRILSRYFDNVSIPNLSVGLYGAKAKQFSVRYNDATFRFEEMRISWVLKDLLFRKAFKIKGIAISGVSISFESEVKDSIYYEKKINHPDLDQATLRKYAEAIKDKINKIFFYSRCPISVNGLVMTGTFDFYEKTLGEFSLALSNFVPSSDAHLAFVLSSSFSRKFDGGFSVKGEGEIHRQANGMVDKLQIDSVITSKNYTDDIKKEFGLCIDADRASSKAHINFTDNDESRKIASFVLEKSPRSGTLNMSINADLDDSILQCFLFGNKSGAWSATLNSKGESADNKSDWILKSHLDLNLSREVLSNIIPGVNSPICAHLTSSLNFQKNGVELVSFTANVEDVNKQRLKYLCELRSPLKISCGLNIGGLSLIKMLNSLDLDLNVDRFYLDNARIIYPNTTLSGMGQGKFNLQVRENGIFLSSKDDKIQLQNINWAYYGQPIVGGFDLETRLNCRISDGVELEFSKVVVSDRKLRSTFLQGGCKVALKKDQNNLFGYFVSDLPTLLAQPLFENSSGVTTGISSINFDIESVPGKAPVGEIGIKLKSISLSGERKSLNGEFDAKIFHTEDANKAKFDVFSNVHYLGDTNLELHGVLTEGADNGPQNMKASLHGDKLCVSDILVLKDIFKVKKFGSKSLNFVKNDKNFSHKRNKLDEISLDLSLGIDEIFWKTFSCLSGLTCDVKCDNKGICIPNLKCYVFEAPLTGNWNFIRDIGEYSDVYSTNISFQLSNLNASKCVHSLGYDPASFTGQFNLEGNLESEQSSLKEVFPRLHGSIRLNGQSGKVRFSSFLNDNRKGLLGFAGAAGNIIGEKSAIVSRLINYFDDLPYDSVTASIVRGGDSNIVLDNFVVKNPDMKFLSRGKIFYSPNTDIKDYGLFVDSQIFTKGELTNLLDQIDLIAGEADYYGYSSGPHVAIHGTVGEPDISELSNLFKRIGNIIINDDQSLLNPKNLFQIFGK